MAAPFDNSPEKSSNKSSHHTGEGVVMDIGTGDGRFVSAAARANPNKFYIGVDANARALEKISMRATRKPKKGGLPNAMFVQAAVEDLPDEFDGTADEIHIHFPWGSLLRAVATGDDHLLTSLRRVAAPECLLEIVIGVDAERDKTEIERLGLPEITPDYLRNKLIPKFGSTGFTLIEFSELERTEWSKIESSWAKKLSPNANRSVVHILFRAP